MKLFKKSVSIFLALLMVFGSMSLMATAADAEFNWSVDTKFYRFDGTDWVETTKAAKGEAVKARIFLNTDFNLDTAALLYFYSGDFLTIDTSACSEGSFDGSYALTMNDSNCMGDFIYGYGNHAIFGDMIYDGYMDEEFIADKSWIHLYTELSTSAVIDGSNWYAEIDFVVKEEPTAVGQFYLSVECISDYDNWLAPTTISAVVDGEKFISTDVDTGTFACTLNDTDADSSLSCDNTVTFTTDNGTIAGTTEYAGYIGDALSTIDGFTVPTASASGKQFLGWSLDGSTVISNDDIKAMKVGYEPIELKAVFQAATATYKQNVYTMGTDGKYPDDAESDDIGAATGAKVNASTYSVPPGFTLDTAKSTAGDVTVTADGTAALDIYLKRNQYKATFGATSSDVYYGAEYTAPAGADTETGIFEYWETTDAEGNTVTLMPGKTATMGLGDVTYTAKYKTIYKVNYVFAGTKPEGQEDLPSTTTTEGAIIAKPAVTVPNGYTLVWTANGATANEDGSFTAGAGNVTITGTWAKIPYSVTYVYAGDTPDGYTAPAGTTATVGDAITAPAVEIPDGYTLTWATEGDVDGAMGTAPVIMTGTWAKIPYTVTYVFTGDAPVAAPKAETATIGEAVVLPDMIADGWTFNGWKVTGAVAGDAAGEYKVGTSNVTVTGTWTKNVYVVNFWFDFGMTELYDSQEYSFGDPVNYPGDPADEVLPEPGTYFDGWDQDIIDVIDADTADTYFVEDAETPGRYVYNNCAYIVEHEYTISVAFRYRSSENAIVNTVPKTSIAPKYYGDEITIDDLPLTEEEGYEFTGWTVSLPYTVTKNATIFAEFKAETYNAIFDANGGAWLNGDTSRTFTVDYGTDIVAPFEDPVRTGYHIDPDMKWDPELGTMFNEDQTFYANWVANTYTITFDVEGTKTESTQTYGKKLAVPAGVVTENVKPGYTFAGWKAEGSTDVIADITTVDVPAGDTTYTAVFEPTAGGVDYTINRYFMNTSGNYDGVVPETDTAKATVDTKVTYTDENITGFTLDTTRGDLVIEKVDGNGNSVINAYYARDKQTVTYIANGETVDTAEVYYDAALTASDDYTAAPVGYTLLGWSRSSGATAADADLGKMGTDDVTLYAVIKANDNTEYKVEIYLMGADGKYGAAADVKTKTGTTGELGTAAHADYAQDAYYSADETAANETSKVITGDGLTTLKLYYKRAKYDVKVDGQVVASVHYGAAYTAPAAATAETGFHFDKWTDGTNTYAPGDEIIVTGALELEAVFAPNTNTEYKVEIYLMGADGNYGAAADVKTKTGTTGELGTAAHADYAQEAYYSADETAANETSAAIKADGTTTLKLYYKRATYAVTVDGAVADAAVIHGASFTTPSTSTATAAGYSLTGWSDGAKTYGLGEEIVVTAPVALTAINTPNNYTVTFTTPDGATVQTGEYAYGTKISTIAPKYTTPAGYEFGGWSLDGVTKVEFTDDVTVPVDGVTYVAIITPASGTAYTVETYVMNVTGVGYAKSSETKYDVTDTEIVYAPEAKTGFTVNNEKSVLTGTVTGDGKMTIKVFYDRNKYAVTVDGSAAGEVYYLGTYTTPAASSSTAAGYTLTGWTDGTNTYGLEEDIVVTGALNLTAINTPNKYKVTFKVQGTDFASGEYDFGTAIVDPGVPTLAGYTFGGWAKNGTPVDLANETVPASNVVYTAILTAKTDTAYTVKKVFQNTDGLTWGEPVDDVRYGTTGATVEIVAEDEAVDGFEVYNIDPATVKIAGDGSTVIYVYYERNTVSVTINGDKDDYYYGETIETPEEPKKDGYTFGGWVDKDGNTVNFPIEVPNEDLVITPVFTANTVSLSFVVDGVAVEGYPVNAKVDSTITAPTAPKKEGYNFVDWYIKGTNTAFNGKMPTADTVYEARYTAGTNTKVAVEIYTMNTEGVYEKTVAYTFGVTDTETWIEPNNDLPGLTPNLEKSKLSDVVAADGSTVLSIYYDRDLYEVTWIVDGAETTKQVYYGADVVAPADPAKDGYTFAGWTPEVPATMPEENLEFTATWAEAEYTVTYVVNGVKTPKTYKYGETVTVMDAPYVEGMTFNGWFDGDVEYVAGSTFTMPANDIIIVADFSIGVYKATFLNADGSVFATEMVKFGDEIPVPEAEPTKEYHVFKGWNMVYDTMPEMNITIEPIFERVPVKLIPMAGSTTIIDRDINVITGLREYIVSEDILRNSYLDVEGDGFFTITPVASKQYGTGTKVELYDNADPTTPIETYVIVIYGDINGDSAVQAVDSTYADDEGLMLTNWSEETVYDAATGTVVANPNYDPYKVMAADLNGDGIIDAIDATIIGDASIGITRINQVTGRPA